MENGYGRKHKHYKMFLYCHVRINCTIVYIHGIFGYVLC
jgi:hypothetical protein